jgi:hypothetical protein
VALLALYGLLLGCIAGLFLGRMLSYFALTEFITELKAWQDFIGAVVGAILAAITALGVFFVSEYSKNESERRAHMHLLHRSIGAALSNLSEIDVTLHAFADTKLPMMRQNIDNDTARNAPSIGHAFVPLMHVYVMSDDLLRVSSGSGYVDVQTIFLVGRSKDLKMITEDINRQFDRTVDMNTQIVMAKVNADPKPANEGFKSNIAAFENNLRDGTFAQNIPIYARELILAQYAVHQLIEMGLPQWKRYFASLGITQGIDVAEKITEHFRKEVNKRIAECEPEFPSGIRRL